MSTTEDRGRTEAAPSQPYVDELVEILRHLGWSWSQPDNPQDDGPDLHTFVRKYILRDE